MRASQDLVEAKKSLLSRLLTEEKRRGGRQVFRHLRVADAVNAAETNLHSIGIGKKYVAGKSTDQLCVRLYVVQKMAPSLLPKAAVLPAEIDGIVTDVIESPRAFVLSAAAPPAPAPPPAQTCTDLRTRSQRPVLGGISASHSDVTDGTIACICRSVAADDDPDDRYILGNNHVFANINRPNPGVLDLLQPSPSDGGTLATDRIATLHKFHPINLGDLSSNTVDAAIGKLLPGIEWRPEICSIGPIKGMAAGHEGMEVCKHGRSTGYTEGVLVDESVTVQGIGMSHHNFNLIADFQDQFRVESASGAGPFCAPGDSGALILNRQTREAVGMLFAGDGAAGIVNPIQDIMNALQITIVLS